MARTVSENRHLTVVACVVFATATLALAFIAGWAADRFGTGPAVAWGVVATATAVAGAVFVSRLWLRLGSQFEHADARYRWLFEQNLAGVAFVSLGGEVRMCNPSFARIFGYASPDEVIGAPVERLYLRAGDRDAVLNRLREDGQLRNFEMGMRRRDGTTVWVLSNIARARNESGEELIESTVVDITDRKSLEQQVQQGQKLEALGRLAGGVAHDFNNVLTAILGYADLLAERFPASGPEREDANEIVKAAQRASTLTRQLLAFSRKQTSEPRVLDLHVVVRDVERMLKPLIGQRVMLAIATDAELGRVLADPGHVEQVLMNLVLNARDAMGHEGTITIETRNVELDEAYAHDHVDARPGAYVMLAVSDTGSGMDAATLGHVFEPFFTTKEAGKGTGLGLATVYGIVRQAGGHVAVYSEVGVGTTFKCYFPTTHSALTIGPASALAVAPGRGGTILVVEDEGPVRQLVVSALERAGFRVISAADGDAAIRAAELHGGHIDLLLSDGVLSGMRVAELLRRFREQRPDTRLLLMSGYSQEAVLKHELVTPGTAFLPKPFTTAHLVTKVQEVLDAPWPPAARAR